MFGDVSGLSYPTCPGIIKHKYISNSSTIPLYIPQVSANNIVVNVHVEKEFNGANELIGHFCYLFPEFFLSERIAFGLRTDYLWFWFIDG